MARVPDRLDGLTAAPQRSGRRDLAVLGVAFGVPLLVLSVERALLHGAHGPETELGPLLGAFVHGLRFDAAGVAYPFAIALIVATVAALRGRRRIERAALAAVTLWTGVVVSFELPFFAEFRSRLDGTALEYLDDLGTVIGTTDWRMRLSFAVALLATGLVTRFAARRLRRTIEKTSLPTRALWARGIAVILVAVFIRGGIDRPLRPADAAASTHHLTQLTLSGPWTILRSAYERSKDGGDLDYGVGDEDAALALIRTALFPGSPFVRDDRPMLRQVGIPGKQRRSAIVVVLESFAAQHVGALGAAKSWTPQLDALIAERGDLYTRCLANGPTTNRALPALLAGIPSTLRHGALTKSLDGQRELLTIGRVLGEQGWRTAFLTGGAASWENLGGWCKGQGFAEVVDRDAFPVSERLSVWGVADGPLFRKALALCDGSAAGGTPFCVVVLTGSNHPPYAVPEAYRPDVRVARERAMRYADDAAAEFVRTVLARNWAATTDVYLVGDHGVTSAPRAVIDPERHHVLLWTTRGGDEAATTHDAVVSHVDVPATLLRMCGYQGEFAGWGAGLGSEHGAPAVLGSRGGARVLATVRGDIWLVDHLDGPTEAFRWDARSGLVTPLLRADPVPSVRRTTQHGRALLHLADRALREGRAGR